MNEIKRNLTDFLTTTITASSEGSQWIYSWKLFQVSFYSLQAVLYFQIGLLVYSVCRTNNSKAQDQPGQGENQVWGIFRGVKSPISRCSIMSDTSTTSGSICLQNLQPDQQVLQMWTGTEKRVPWECLIHNSLALSSASSWNSKVNTSICILGESHLDQCLKHTWEQHSTRLLQPSAKSSVITGSSRPDAWGIQHLITEECLANVCEDGGVSR